MQASMFGFKLGEAECAPFPLGSAKLHWCASDTGKPRAGTSATPAGERSPRRRCSPLPCEATLAEPLQLPCFCRAEYVCCQAGHGRRYPQPVCRPGAAAHQGHPAGPPHRWVRLRRAAAPCRLYAPKYKPAAERGVRAQTACAPRQQSAPPHALHHRLWSFGPAQRLRQHAAERPCM